MTIEIPDELARGLEAVAASHDKTVEQLALERLRTLLDEEYATHPGSAAAILRVMHDAPHLSVEDVDELDDAIASARRPAQYRDPFAA